MIIFVSGEKQKKSVRPPLSVRATGKDEVLPVQTKSLPVFFMAGDPSQGYILFVHARRHWTRATPQRCRPALSGPDCCECLRSFASSLNRLKNPAPGAITRQQGKPTIAGKREFMGLPRKIEMMNLFSDCCIHLIIKSVSSETKIPSLWYLAF
jgi:hypothetical protein